MALWAQLSANKIKFDSLVVAALVDALAGKGQVQRALGVVLDFERCRAAPRE